MTIVGSFLTLGHGPAGLERGRELAPGLRVVVYSKMGIKVAIFDAQPELTPDPRLGTHSLAQRGHFVYERGGRN